MRDVIFIGIRGVATPRVMIMQRVIMGCLVVFGKVLFSGIGIRLDLRESQQMDPSRNFHRRHPKHSSNNDLVPW